MRINPVKFLSNWWNDIGGSVQDFERQVAAKISKVDPKDIHKTMTSVTMDLLKICADVRGKEKKARIAYLIIHFLMEYPKMFDHVCTHLKFLSIIVRKMVEFSCERSLILDGRPFMLQETIDMIDLLEKGGHDVHVQTLRGTLANESIEETSRVMIP